VDQVRCREDQSALVARFRSVGHRAGVDRPATGGGFATV
jgi:hypothetical protein